MKTYIITRFSILDIDSKSWTLTRESNSETELINKLFDEKRLDEKLFAFEHITYKSLINQVNKDFIWYIITSKYLPSNYKEKIYKFKKENIKVIEVENMSEFNSFVKNIDYEKEYATVRLDDDDGLNLLFIDKLKEIYKNSNKEEVVSFYKGRKITKHNNQIIVENDEFIYKKIAAGLCKFNGNIYSCGNHTEIDQKYEVIYDDSENMFFIWSSEYCDTKRKFNMSNIEKFELFNY